MARRSLSLLSIAILRQTKNKNHTRRLVKRWQIGRRLSKLWRFGFLWQFKAMYWSDNRYFYRLGQTKPVLVESAETVGRQPDITVEVTYRVGVRPELPFDAFQPIVDRPHRQDEIAAGIARVQLSKIGAHRQICCRLEPRQVVAREIARNPFLQPKRLHVPKGCGSVAQNLQRSVERGRAGF